MGFRNLNFSDGSVVPIIQAMNTITHALASQRPLAFQLGAGMAGRLRGVVDTLRGLYRSAPRGHAELRGMSDLELRDLGIGRSEVGHVLGDAR